jgi:flagellar motor switch protein FliN/FliY
MSDEVDEINEQDAADDWGAALNEQAEAEATEEGGADDWGAALSEQADAEAQDVETAEMQPLQADAVITSDEVNLDVILEIPVTLSMEIGRTEISIRNLLQLNQGSVIELDRLAGEPMDVMVNGTLVAHGEVVVVNEKFGIRLTDIISPQERVKKLR